MKKTKLDRKNFHTKKIHLEIDDFFYDVVPKDYLRFMDEVILATTPRQKELLAVQSCHGHAMNGDKEFTEQKGPEKIHHRYPNSTISDVYRAVIKAFPDYSPNLNAVMHERQNLIDELKGWIIEALNKTKNKKDFSQYSPRRLIDKNGEPLMGIEMFRHTSINDPRSVLIGLYLGAYMDSGEWRERTEDYFREVHGFDLNMHKGLCTAGNLERIVNEGLTLSDLSHIAYDPLDSEKENVWTIGKLKEKGLIVDYSGKMAKKNRRKGVQNKKPYVPVFVEVGKGYGSSDDAAFNFASIMYGLDAGFGLILADAVDTADKCLPYIKEKGEDELLGDFIKYQLGGEKGIYHHLEIKKQDILNLIFAAAVDADHPDVWPSCSQRRFLECSSKGYALLTHIDNVKHIKEDGPSPEPIKLSIKQIHSYKFYNAFSERIKQMIETNVLNPTKAQYSESLDYFIE